MAEYYLYLKYLHYLFFISWMAVLFYQPRLYVYHVENMDKPDFIKVVEVMEYKMYHYIGWVALIGSFVTGILILIAMPDLIKTGHIHVKISCHLNGYLSPRPWTLHEAAQRKTL